MGLFETAFNNEEMGLLMAFINAVRGGGHNVGMHIDGSVTIDGENRTKEELKRLARRWNNNNESIDDLLNDTD